MTFKNFDIKVNYNGKYDFYTSDNKVIILNQDGDTSVLFKIIEDSVVISSISYDTEVIIDSSIKKVDINISDPIEFE